MTAGRRPGALPLDPSKGSPLQTGVWGLRSQWVKGNALALT